MACWNSLDLSFSRQLTQKINKKVQLAPLKIVGKLIFLLDFDARSIDPVLCQSNRVFSSLLLFFSCFLSVLNLCCSHGAETFEIKTFVLAALLFMLQRQWLSVEAFCFTSKTKHVSPQGDQKTFLFEFFCPALKPALNLMEEIESHGRDFWSFVPLPPSW